MPLSQRTLTLVVISALASLLVAGLTGPARGFSPAEEYARWEVPRLGAPSQAIWTAHSIEDQGAPAGQALAAFAGAYGGSWQYQINGRTGTYHHLYGSGVDLGVALKTREDVERVARDFVAANPAVFAATNENLTVASCTNALGKWSIIFQETYRGVPVWGGRVHLVFTEAGRLFEMGSDAHPGISIPVEPALKGPDALTVAQTDIGFQETTDKVQYQNLFILPIEVGEAGIEYRLSWRVDLRVASPYGLWATWVDAAGGEILWRENHVRFTNFTGHVQGDVDWNGYCDGYTNDYPLRDMNVTVSGVGTASTNATGDFTVTYGGTGQKTITAAFVGPWVNVDRATGTDASHTGTITAGTPYTIDWADATSLASERDGFAYTNAIHAWTKAMDPSFTALDYQMICTIERTDMYCPGNAWWDGTNINFCSQTASYGNTARMADVVYHEYTHGITQEMYGISEPPGDVHEGNSDVAANLLTRESIMGLGFYYGNCSTGIRNSQNSMQYPCYDEIHICGQILAGFYWDSWQGMLAAYPQAVADSVARVTWHFGRKLGLPQSQPDQVHWTFVADDNDGNLANGTPHYDQFCVGAENHGFTCPEITTGVMISHTPLSDTPNTTDPYPVTAVITSTAGPIVADSCRVVYRVDGGSFANAGMSPTGGADEYRGYIPAQPAGSTVEYYIYGRDTAGNTKTNPGGAPSVLHAFRVGYETVLADDFETNKGWTVGAAGDNAVTGIWERCDPEGTAAQPEDDHTPAPGVNAYITDCAAGLSLGDFDVDGGKTTLLSPILNLSSYDEAVVRYYRWYSNDTGAEPGTDYWVVEVTNNGSTWVTLENTNVSSATWQMKQFNVESYVALTSQVRFRFIASDYDPGSLVEAGVDDFSLVALAEPSDTMPPVVTVIAPNGGEELIGGAGAIFDVVWSASDDVGVTLTKILLSTDGGATYPDTLASGALTSPWTWVLPEVDEAACRTKVVCYDAAANAGSDQSDANFHLVSLSGVPDRKPLPGDVVLLPSRPSPFETLTEIEFGLPEPGRVLLRVYGVDGRLVTTLVDGARPAGYHVARWQGTDSGGAPVSAGMYFYRLETADRVLTRKMLMIR